MRVLGIDARVDAEAADRLIARDTASGETRAPRSDAFLGRVRTIVRHDVLARLWQSDDPLPVGTSLYPSAKDATGFELVTSQYGFVRLTLDGPDGPCEHDLVIDDGALFTVGPEERTEAAAKLEHLPCLAAARDRDGDRFAFTRSYLVPCQHGDHEWHHTWTPERPRLYAGRRAPHDTQYDRVGRLMSAIPRIGTEEFARVLRLCNYSESYNHWFKSALPRYGRAASMSQRGQEFDFLMGALAANAVTWHHSQQ